MAYFRFLVSRFWFLVVCSTKPETRNKKQETNHQIKDFVIAYLALSTVTWATKKPLDIFEDALGSLNGYRLTHVRIYLAMCLLG